MSRTAIPQFSLANPYYIGGTVTFYTVESGAATTTLATLYAGTTGSTQLNNPQQLDGEGKYSAAVYIEDSVIGVVTGPNVESHATGIINPSTGGGGGGSDTPGGFSGQLQYNNAAAFGGTTAGTYQGSGALFTFAAQAAGDTPLVLKGSAAQSASLQEWRNSAGTALSRITKDGYLGLVASGYINFDTTDGASGYGLRDNAGDIEFKDAGGAWTALNSLSGSGGAGGTLPSLANGSIWIGNGSAVATARTLSGDITVTNTGVTAIGSGKVTNAMLAGSIAASKLVGTDIATVGTLTAGATGAGFTIALGTSSVTGRVGASNLPQVSGRSVWANSGNGTADVASLQSSAGGQILNSTASSIAWTETPILGAAGSTVGSIGFQNATSGTITVQPTTGALGSVTLTLPATTGTFALTGNKLSVFAATTSAELAGVITDETGSGALVFAASPTLTGTLTAAAATFSGVVTHSSTTTLSGALTYGGVTLSNAATGTGNMVLSASPTFTGTVAMAGLNLSGALAVTAQSTTALAVGRLGTTTPAFQVDSNTASSITGVKITAAATGNGVAMASVGETNVALTITAAGTGSLTLTTGSAGGTIFFGRQTRSSSSSTVNPGYAGFDNLSGLDVGTALRASLCANSAEFLRVDGSANRTSIYNSLGSEYFRVDNTTGNTNFVPALVDVTRSIATTAAPTWNDLWVKNTTTTLTGNTHVTSPIAKSSFFGGTLTDSSSVTVDLAYSVYIDAPPAAAGSVTITSPWSLWVNSGRARFAGLTVNDTAIFNNGVQTIATSGAEVWSDVEISDGTLTLTGTTTTTDLARVYVGQSTITDSSSVTVGSATTLYVKGPPLAGGSVTITTGKAWAFRLGSGNMGLPASGYLNWGTTGGTGGYGVRDNGGTIEIKNSGGSWAAPSAGATGVINTCKIATAVITNSATTYAGLYGTNVVDATEDNVKTPLPRAGTLRNFYIQTFSTNGTGGSLVGTVRVNKADTTIVVTIGSGATAATFSDTTHTASVSAGDVVDVKWVSTVSSGSSAAMNGTIEFA